MREYQEPQPSWPLIVSSLLIMAGAVLIAAGLFSAVIASDEFRVVAGLFFLPFPLAFILLQYRGTFQGQPGSAALAGVMSLGVGVFSFIFVGIGILGSLAFGSFSEVFLVLSIGMPLTALTILLAQLNFNWANDLHRHYRDIKESPPQMRFSLRELLGAMALASVIAGLGVSFTR